MNHTKPVLTVTVLLSIFLFVWGKVFFIQIFEFFEPKIEGIKFQIIEHNRIFKTSFLLSIILALIPISIFLTWRLAPITSSTKKLFTILIILLFIVIGIWLRHQGIKSYFTKIVKNIVTSNDNISVKYPLDPVAYVYVCRTLYRVRTFINSIEGKKRFAIKS